MSSDQASSSFRVAGLFAGIGGLELGFERAGHSTIFLNEIWEPARDVLRQRFPDAPIVADVKNVDTSPATALPPVDVINAGFPCQDLSQAGRTAGIEGDRSGLVGEVFRLLSTHEPQWLVLENVRNMLYLDSGRAMHYLTTQMEHLGYRWAYRVVDSRFTGVPQRRHRVILAASKVHDPRPVLLNEDVGEDGRADDEATAFGFYWTEGLRGVGWAVSAVPPLKGGSGLGIPSPPGIWVPGARPGRKLVTPSIEDAEALQGFDRRWTEVAHQEGGRSARWTLVGNAVTVGVGNWVGERLSSSEPYERGDQDEVLEDGETWPSAAWGDGPGGRRHAVDVSAWPRSGPYQQLSTVVDLETAPPLSRRAAAGFLSRTERSSLNFVPEFLVDVKEHVDFYDDVDP